MVNCSRILDYIKFIIQKITCGKYSSNLFFKKKQEHSTWYASLLTVFGVALITILSIFVIQDILEQRQVTVQFSKLDETLKFSPYDFFTLTAPRLFIQQTQIYDWNQMYTYEEQVKFLKEQHSNYPCGGYFGRIINRFAAPYNMTCVDKVSNIVVLGNQLLFIYQYILDFDLEQFQSFPKSIDFTFMLVCYDANVCVSNDTSGKEAKDIVVLQNKDYYFDNINQMKPVNKSQTGLSLDHMVTLSYKPIQFNKTDSIIQISPEFTQTYYFTTSIDAVLDQQDHQICDDSHNKTLCFLFRQELGDQITITPRSLTSGLAQIGGYFSIFAIVILLMRQMHRYCLNRNLQQYLDQRIQEDQKRTNKKLKIHELFSYEKFFEINVELSEIKKDNRKLRNEIAYLRKYGIKEDHSDLSTERNHNNQTKQELPIDKKSFHLQTEKSSQSIFLSDGDREQLKQRLLNNDKNE